MGVLKYGEFLWESFIGNSGGVGRRREKLKCSNHPPIVVQYNEYGIPKIL
jgi:hypothetical protein